MNGTSVPPRHFFPSVSSPFPLIIIQCISVIDAVVSSRVDTPRGGGGFVGGVVDLLFSGLRGAGARLSMVAVTVVVVFAALLRGVRTLLSLNRGGHRRG